MSTASTTRTVRYIKRSGTYMPWFTTNQGDLFQEYDNDTSSKTITPSWSGLKDEAKPIIEFVCMSSRVAEGEMSIDFSQITWYFNDDEIVFSTTNSSGDADNPVYAATGTYAGYFSKIKSNGRMALRIDNDLVELGGYASISIKAVATIVSGSYSDQIQATYQISISQSSSGTFRVNIMPGDSYNFVISSKSGNGSSVIMKAVLYNNGAVDTEANKTYKWYKMTDDNTWTQVTGIANTADSITVTESDVSTFTVYKVEVYGADGSYRGQDTQGVTDVTDPYMVIPNPTPSDEQIISGSGGSVVYAPYVQTRAGATVSAAKLFDFYAYNAKMIWTGQATNTATFEVTEDMCEQANGDVSVIITSNEFSV
jgi:hypothetical protein